MDASRCLLVCRPHPTEHTEALAKAEEAEKALAAPAPEAAAPVPEAPASDSETKA